MGAPLRRLLTFGCEGAELGASLDMADGATGILFVTGGTQTRIGSHRLFERLATRFAARGTPCFRYDRRGVGDSDGVDPGWRNAGPDLAAAGAAFRSHCPGMTRVIGIGLCDGATVLALSGASAGIDGAILINPWLVDSAPGELAPAAIRQFYQERLLSPASWKKLLVGAISWRKLFAGIRKLAAGSDRSLGSEVAAALRGHSGPIEAIIATGDATGIAARHELSRPALAAALRQPPTLIETSSHTFSRTGDFAALHQAIVAALQRG